MASTAAGSVLSRAVREVAPKLAASTWGARLEPPMPHTTTRVSPSRRTAAAKRVSSCHCASEARGASIQPRWLIGRQKHNPPSPPVRQALRLAHEAARGSRDCNRPPLARRRRVRDRKSTRLNSSHSSISYAVFCLKKKNYIKIKLILTFQT